MKESEKQLKLKEERYKNFVLSTCKKLSIDHHVIDYVAMFDNALSLSENKDAFFRYLKTIGHSKEKTYSKQELEAIRIEQEAKMYEEFKKLESKELEDIKVTKDTRILEKIYWELNQKFDTFLKADARKVMLVIGDSGIGKTHTILHRALTRTRRIESNRGVSTAAGLNDFLASYSNGYLLIIDDNEGWVEDRKAVSLIKAGAEKPYTVKWTSKGSAVEHKQWVNQSKWILIMNEKPRLKMWNPIFSRAYVVEIKLDYYDKIKLIFEIAKIQNIPDVIPKFIATNTNPSTERLDIRTLEKSHEFFLNNPQNWQNLVLTEIKRDPRREYILDLVKDGGTKKDMVRQFTEAGHGSRATFYRLQSHNLTGKKVGKHG